MKIPLEFIKALKERSNAHKILWLDWLADHAETVMQDDFLIKYKCPYGELSQKRIREIWEFGVARLGEGLFSGIEIVDSALKKRPKNILLICEKVIGHLNAVTGSAFEADASKTVELIGARMKEGYGIEDFIRVIDKKANQWKGTDQEVYLRPITLFSKTKFENYLNEVQPKEIHESKQSDTGLQRIRSAAEKAKSFNIKVGKNPTRG